MIEIMKQWSAAILVIGLSASGGFSGETQVYQFENWTIAVTPGISRSAPVSPTNVPMESDRVQRVEANNRYGIIVMPVSLKQDAPEPSPEPMPEDNVPALKSVTESPVNRQQLKVDATKEQRLPVTFADDSQLPVITPRCADYSPFRAPAVPQVANYRDVYNSIPFNRAEYNANPSYRHDATMEFLFNQLRPTTIQRSTTNVYQYDMNSWYPPYYHYGWRYGNRLYSTR